MRICLVLSRFANRGIERFIRLRSGCFGCWTKVSNRFVPVLYIVARPRERNRPDRGDGARWTNATVMTKMCHERSLAQVRECVRGKICGQNLPPRLAWSVLEPCKY